MSNFFFWSNFLKIFHWGGHKNLSLTVLFTCSELDRRLRKGAFGKKWFRVVLNSFRASKKLSSRQAIMIFFLQSCVGTGRI